MTIPWRVNFYHVTIDNATIEEEMKKDGETYVNIRWKSTFELVRNYFRKNIPCNISKKYKYVDMVTVYISHSKKNNFCESHYQIFTSYSNA